MSSEFYEIVPYIFWSVVLIVGAVLYGMHLHYNGHRQNTEVSTVFNKYGAIYEDLDRGPKYHVKHLHPPPEVDFNPFNEEHVLALAMLVLLPEKGQRQRQHPHLRFKFDSNFDNAVAHCSYEYMKATFPKEVIRRVEQQRRIANA
jgi:hypothetical protein